MFIISDVPGTFGITHGTEGPLLVTEDAFRDSQKAARERNLTKLHLCWAFLKVAEMSA